MPEAESGAERRCLPLLSESTLCQATGSTLSAVRVCCKAGWGLLAFGR